MKKRKGMKLHETYKGYKIYHRARIKRRPWRCEVPGTNGRMADEYTLQGCKKLRDRQISRSA